MPPWRALTRHRRLLLCCLLVVIATACGGSPARPSPAPTGTALSLVCPADMATFAAGPDGIEATFEPATASGGVAPVAIECDVAPGMRLPVGRHVVTCSARDAAGAMASCQFAIDVAPPPPHLAYTHLLAFGDSFTEGRVVSSAFGWPIVDNPSSYPARLRLLLSERYAAQTITVENFGQPGENAREARPRLQALLAAEHPEVVLLMEGVNDLNALGQVSAPTSRVIDVTKALTVMVRDARAAGAQVLLATLPPQREGGSRALGVKLLPAFNNEVRRVAQREDAPLVDVERAFGDDPELIGPDGLHPTEKGYEMMAETFFTVIRRRFEVETSPTPTLFPDLE